MTKQSNSDTYCPFWDKYGKRICRLAESGLFIPTQEHILSFCENELYINCDHYVGKSVSHEKAAGSKPDRTLQNRRQFTRIPTSQKLSVTRYSLAKEADEDILDEQATAVDLSLGGMRIETNAPINVNQLVSFSFDDYFQPSGFKGKGEIRWIIQDEFRGAPISAGLAFVDKETADTVRNHLLAMGEKLLRHSGF